jgi:hypothetical protein
MDAEGIKSYVDYLFAQVNTSGDEGYVRGVQVSK